MTVFAVVLGLTIAESASPAPIRWCVNGEPKKIAGSKAEYPPEAVAAGLSGTVTVELTVGKSGEVASTRVTKGVPPLSTAAESAMKTWRYRPFLGRGEPQAFIVRATAKFDAGLSYKTPPKIDGLIASLGSQHTAVRESAARWLGRIHRTKTTAVARAQRALQELLATERNGRVRAAASEAMARLSPGPRSRPDP
jgi:TonB family protein